MSIVMAKDKLIEHLTERLKLAKAEDALKLAAHRSQEQAALLKFRERLREALKWDYKKAKEYCYRKSISIESPACPSSQAAAIDRELRCVKLDVRKQFTVTPKTELFSAVNWLPEAERPRSSMCD